MWEEDELGPGFRRQTLHLHDDDEGPVTATIVQHVPADDPHARPGTPSTPRFAVLALHGWNDYFYQVELARNLSAMGAGFFAVDLRKYGRSYLPHQTRGFTLDLSDYDEDIHACLDVVYATLDPDIPLVFYGHSTGGLTATLWADRHPGALAGLILNSPWLEVQGATIVRQLSRSVLDSISRFAPETPLPLPEDLGFYNRSLTGWREEGEVVEEDDPDDPFTSTGWIFNPDWRSAPSPPIRAGWLRTIFEGHRRVAHGLDIACPILVLTSNRTVFSDRWSPDMRSTDTVLDVEQIWRRVPELGRLTTLARFEGAIHDVALSRASVRRRVFGEMARWIRAYI